MKKLLMAVLGIFSSFAASNILAAPVVSIIDGDTSPWVEVGERHSLQSRNNLPVISYSVVDRAGDNIIYDAIKLAFCISGCDSSPQYNNYIVANTHSLGGINKLAINKGKPVIAYYEGMNDGTLKIASCIGRCYTTNPEYVTANVVNMRFSDFDIGMVDGQPVLAYGSDTINIAYCTENCQSSKPTFFKRSTGFSGANISNITMKIVNGRPVIAYQTTIDWGYTRIYSVNVISCTTNCFNASGIYQKSFYARGSLPALALDTSRRPILSYAATDGLKIAYCQRGCYSAKPVYNETMLVKKIATSSMAVNSSNQVFVSFHDGYNFKLAYCKTGCDAVAPVYQRRTMPATANRSMLKMFSDKPAMSFYDSNRDLSIVACDKPACGV